MDEHPRTIDIPTDIATFLGELHATVDDLRENEWVDGSTHAILRAKLRELESLAEHDPMILAGLAYCMQAVKPPW